MAASTNSIFHTNNQLEDEAKHVIKFNCYKCLCGSYKIFQLNFLWEEKRKQFVLLNLLSLSAIASYGKYLHNQF